MAKGDDIQERLIEFAVMIIKLTAKVFPLNRRIDFIIGRPIPRASKIYRTDKKFDILLLTETHIGYSTNITVNNFSYYPVCMKKSNNNKYVGWLGILIKKNIRKGLID